MAAVRAIFPLQALRTTLTPSHRHSFLPTCSHIQHMNYAKPMGMGKKGRGKLGPALEKVRLPVETDGEKLVKFVCGSHPVKEDRQDIEIKEDSEYPDWLWELRTGKPPPLEEMDPDSKQYHRRLRTQQMNQNNVERKLRRF